MPKIVRRCNECNTSYEAEKRYLDRDQGQFCSRSCSSSHHAKARSKKLEPNCSCATCGKTFYKSPSRMKASKSGWVFCSRLCKEMQQTTGGLLELPHYGTGTWVDYRSLGIDAFGAKCQRCEYSRYPQVLQVHHKDRDRSNNKIDNLEVLCPTCHLEDHFIEGDGLWAAATPKKPRNWPPTESPKRIAEMVSETNYSAVAREFGVVPNTVRNLLKRHNLLR